MNTVAALLLRFASILFCASPASAIELDLRAAWGGIARISGFTELTIGVRSPEAGTFTILLPGADAQTSIMVDLPQDQRIEFSVPYPVSQPGPVVWAVRQDKTVVSTGQAEPFKRVARKPWDIDLSVSAQNPRTANVLAATLPTRTQAYDSIRSITLTPRDLRDLTPKQLRAFEAYLLRCGRAIILETPPALLARLRQLAGCGGRHVHSAGERFRPAELPSSRDVRAIVDCPDCGGTLGRLTALLSVYASLLLAASLLVRLRTLVVLGMAVSVILIVTNHTNRTYVTWLSWAQADAASSSQIRRTVLIVEGRGSSELTVPLPLSSIPQLPLPPGTVLHYLVTRTEVSAATLALPTGYLTRDVLSFLETDRAETRHQDLPSSKALALATRIAVKTGLTLETRASAETVTQPSEGAHWQWYAIVNDPGRAAK